ncbi:hypothetical protein ACIA98_31085 [Streptomyces sp. NPDC051366]|uniref:hypothetical protein n=1 Tax=Streptomyces sp. NPDC051366 TaxID=3365652 RepID=UPI003790D56F
MTVERVIAAPNEEVFGWLTTTTHSTKSPLILRCRLTRHGEGAPYGVGAIRSHLWLRLVPDPHVPQHPRHRRQRAGPTPRPEPGMKTRCRGGLSC